ncbi:hypothetical protein DIPPA_35972, partial [Diplonema papillatum]
GSPSNLFPLSQPESPKGTVRLGTTAMAASPNPASGQEICSPRMVMAACMSFMCGWFLMAVPPPIVVASGRVTPVPWTPQPPPEPPQVFHLTALSSSLLNHSLLNHPFYKDLPGELLNWDFYNKTLLFKNASVQLPRDELRQLVAGRNFLWIGESVLRFHFLLFLRIIEEKDNLDRDLVLGRFNDFIRTHGSKPKDPNLVSLNEWNGWPHFLSGTTKAFDRMCCECRRVDRRPGDRDPLKFWAQQKEYRFYYNKERDVRASFYFTHGDAVGDGLTHNFEDCNALKETAGLADDPSRVPTWNGSANDLAQSLLARNESHNVIMVNAGLWWPKWRTNMTAVAEYVDSLSLILKRAEEKSKHAPVGIWWSTSSSCFDLPKDYGTEDKVLDILMSAAARHGVRWKHFDLKALTEQHSRMIQKLPVMSSYSRGNGGRRSTMDDYCAETYADGIGHLQPFVYKQDCHALFRML